MGAEDLKDVVGHLDGDIRKLLEALESDPGQAGMVACGQLGRMLGQEWSTYRSAPTIVQEVSI